MTLIKFRIEASSREIEPWSLVLPFRTDAGEDTFKGQNWPLCSRGVAGVWAQVSIHPALSGQLKPEDKIAALVRPAAGGALARSRGQEGALAAWSYVSPSTAALLVAAPAEGSAAAPAEKPWRVPRQPGAGTKRAAVWK